MTAGKRLRQLAAWKAKGDALREKSKMVGHSEAMPPQDMGRPLQKYLSRRGWKVR